ncbi:MAG: hypothetical protein P1V20_09880 [Verrucomicrobiales bacterium]|nr:hypothetical protein [Verrucomicrobiales bacterium]
MNRILNFCLACSLLWIPSAICQENPFETPYAAPAEPEPKPEPEIIRKEKSIYLPYEDLEAIFEKEGRGVFLPYREFLDLWNELTIQRKEDREKPPTDGVISSAKYSATVEGTENRVLAVEAIIQAESFKDEGWAVVPLAKSGLNIAEAETGDATLHLGKNGYELILPQKGTYEITLKLYARLTGEAGKNEVQLNLPKAGVSRFEAAIPGAGWEFDLKPAAAYSTRTVDENTQLSFFFGETENFQLIWQKQGEDNKLNPLLFVEGDHKTSLVPGAIQTELTLNYRILRSGVEQFDITVPKGQEILSVEGENIKEWDVTTLDTEQQLSVSLHAPAKKTYRLELTLEQALESLPTEISLPQIKTENVVRQRGSLYIENSSELELETVSTDGLTQQSIAPDQQQQNDVSLLSSYARFRYLSLPFDLTLSVKKAEPLIEVESWTRFSVEPDTTKFEARFDYEVKRAGIFDTQIEIPDDFDGIEATGPVVKDFTEEDVDGKRILTVTFTNRIKGKTSFSVVGRSIREKPDQDTVVPVFAPLNVERHEGKVALSIHSSLDPRTGATGDLRQHDISLSGSKIPGKGAMQIGFRYRGSAEPATVSYTLKKPQVSGEVLTLVEVREQIIRYRWTILYNVKYAGVDTFAISLPESIAENLRYDGPLIKEVNKSYSSDQVTAPDDHVLWAVILRDKKLGNYQLTLNLDLPAGVVSAGEDTPDDTRNFSVSVPEIQLHDVQTETGQIAVVKDDSLEIVDAPATSLEAIDPKELHKNLPGRGVFLSYKYRRHPIALNLKISRNEFLPVPQAVVTYADLTSVLSSDAALTTEVIYLVKNNARQFFSVTLPPGGKMISDIYVDGEPQQPMRRANEDVVLIRLPVDQSGKQFPVRFMYEVPSDRPGRKLGSGSLTIPCAELTDAEVLQSRIQLYVPDDYSYRKFESSMTIPATARGWTRFRNRFNAIVPTLGPQIPVTNTNAWQTPAELHANTEGGFDLKIPTGGKLYRLHRLDEPSDIKIIYRSKGYESFIEALAGLLAFAGAIMMLWRPVKWRFLYFATFGILPLLIAGAVNPMSSGFWTAIYLGTLLGLLVWIAKGIPAFLRYLYSLTSVPFVWMGKKRRQAREQKARKKAANFEIDDSGENPGKE